MKNSQKKRKLLYNSRPLRCSDVSASGNLLSGYQLSLSLCRRGLERDKKKARGGQWEGEREVSFSIVHRSFAFLTTLLLFLVEYSVGMGATEVKKVQLQSWQPATSMQQFQAGLMFGLFWVNVKCPSLANSTEQGQRKGQL